MLMPVPQTLAKKLNKDVFQRGREGSGVHTERGDGHGVSDALQAGEEARTGVWMKVEGTGGGRPSINADKPKSASSTAASGMRAASRRQRRG